MFHLSLDFHLNDYVDNAVSFIFLSLISNTSQNDPFWTSSHHRSKFN